MDKPFIAAADRNKSAILDELRELLVDARAVLEIGAGSGQHAVYFASALPHLRWLATDTDAMLDGIRAWTREADLANLPPPLALDVTRRPWPVPAIDAVYSSNTVHYMPWAAVEAMFTGITEILAADGVFVLYGPFNYGYRYTSEGNRQLDQWLKSENPAFAIRNIEDLLALAARLQLNLVSDRPMPANNRLLVWQWA